MRRIFLPLLAIVVLGGVVLSCGGDDEGPVKLGFLAGLSGDYAEWGPPSQDGAEAALGVINASGGILGRDAELVVQDNLSTAEGAVTGYNRIREEIHALGGVESDGAVALLDTVAEDEMPTMCPACGTTVLDTEGGNYIWRITASDTTYGIISAQLARDLGYTRVAMLVQQTEGTESPRRGLQGRLGEQDRPRDHRRRALPARPGQLPGSGEEAFSGNPEAVYIGAGPQAGIPIIREYIARGYEATLLVSPDLQVPDIAAAASQLPTGRVLAAQVTDDFESPAYSAFAKRTLDLRRQGAPDGLLRDQPVRPVHRAGAGHDRCRVHRRPRRRSPDLQRHERAGHQGVHLPRRCRRTRARRADRLRTDLRARSS